MKPEQLYKRCDDLIFPMLEPLGFRKKESGEYVRDSEKGWDRILVSHGPGAKKNTHFAVFMSYYVRSIETLVDELIDLGDEDRGFPAGPYLNPVSVTSRPKYWGYRTPEALEKSLKHVIECLKNSGLPWLETLRDPKVFADQTDPVAALPSGLAHEAAGNFAKAREAYREMHRRYSEMIAKFGEATVLRRSGKAYVFVTAKLGIDAERRRTFEDELNYHPDIEPLPQ